MGSIVSEIIVVILGSFKGQIYQHSIMDHNERRIRVLLHIFVVDPG